MVKRARGNPPRGGRGAPRSPSPPAAPEIEPVAGFEHVEFEDEQQRERFLRLLQMPFHETRFIDRALMGRFGIGEDMQALFHGTGIPHLYGMAELTYKDITLEFLSSYKFDSQRRAVSFRLRNTDFAMTLEAFADEFGFRTEYVPMPPNYTITAMWFAMSGQETFSTNALKLSDIEDPRLRMWAKSCVHTFLPRASVDRLNVTEVMLLGAFLNPDRYARRGVPYVPGLFANHLNNVANAQRVKSISLGGLITFLAKRLVGFEDGVEGSPPESRTPQLLDLEYLDKVQHWAKRKGRVYEWLAKKEGRREFWVEMPSQRLPTLGPLGPLAAGRPQDRPSFCFNFERGESSRAAEARGQDPRDEGPSGVFEEVNPPRWVPTATEPTFVPPVYREEGFPEAPYSPMRTDGIPEEPLRAPKTEPGWIPMPPRYTPTHPPFDPAGFENQRYIHDRINRNLTDYKQWERWDREGYVASTEPVPSFYWGVGGYPGGVFQEVGVDPTIWGRDYGLRYGGAGGQFYPATWYGGPSGPPEQGGGAAGAGPSNAGPSGPDEGETSDDE